MEQSDNENPYLIDFLQSKPPKFVEDDTVLSSCDYSVYLIMKLSQIMKNGGYFPSRNKTSDIKLYIPKGALYQSTRKINYCSQKQDYFHQLNVHIQILQKVNYKQPPLFQESLATFLASCLYEYDEFSRNINEEPKKSMTVATVNAVFGSIFSFMTGNTSSSSQSNYNDDGAGSQNHAKIGGRFIGSRLYNDNNLIGYILILTELLDNMKILFFISKYFKKLDFDLNLHDHSNSGRVLSNSSTTVTTSLTKSSTTAIEACHRLLERMNVFLMDNFLSLIVQDLQLLVEDFFKLCTNEYLKPF